MSITSIISNVLGTTLAVEKEIRRNMSLVGNIADPLEVNAAVSAFFASENEECFSRMSLSFVLDRLRVTGRIADYICLNGGFYIVDEYLLLLVVERTVEEIAAIAGLGGLEYIGNPPEPDGTRPVTVAIGRLTFNWKANCLQKLLSGTCLSGIGVWGREAYLQLRPNYEGRGRLLFPEPGFGGWSNVSSGEEFCSCLSYNNEHYFRNMESLEMPQFGFDNRLCLLCNK
jgi:hypothetical protein